MKVAGRTLELVLAMDENGTPLTIPGMLRDAVYFEVN